MSTRLELASFWSPFRANDDTQNSYTLLSSFLDNYRKPEQDVIHWSILGMVQKWSVSVP